MAVRWTVADINRIRYATHAETGAVAADLTGRTLHLLVGDLGTIACTVTPGATSSTFTTGAIPSAIADAAAGRYDYILLIDMGDDETEQPASVGDWIIEDRPDGTP